MTVTLRKAASWPVRVTQVVALFVLSYGHAQTSGNVLFTLLPVQAPEHAPAGEAVTITYTARYSGAFDVKLLVDESLDEWSNVKLLARSSADKAWMDENGKQMVERSFRLVVAGVEPGRARIPSIAVSYLINGEPSRMTTEAVKLEITPARVSWLQRLALPAGIVACLAMAGLGGYLAWLQWRRYMIERAQRPPTPREQLAEELRQLRQVRLAGQTHAYFAQAERVLARWVTLAYGIETKPAALKELPPKLTERGVPDTVVARLQILANRAHEGKFSPAPVTSEELERFERELMALVECKNHEDGARNPLASPRRRDRTS